MKGKKVIFFIAAFLLPIAIFIFLKVFGRNEFRVRPLFQDGIIEAPAGCGHTYSIPYTVADTIIAQLGLDRRDSLYVIYFDPSVAPPMRRAAAEYAHAPVKVIGPSDIPANINKTTLQQCAFLMKRDASVVMVDHMRRIRGQYDGSSRDDIDRLLVEIDIILKNY